MTALVNVNTQSDTEASLLELCIGTTSGMFKPLFWLFRVSGMAPTNSHKDKYFTTVAMVFVVLAVYQVHVSWKYSDNETVFSNVLRISHDTFYTNVAIFIVSSYTNRKSFSVVMSKAYQPSFRFETLVLLGFVVYSLIRFFNFLKTSNYWTLCVARLLINCLVHLVVIQHMTLVRALSMRFDLLNERIKSLISQGRVNPIASLTEPLRSTLVEHWDLQDLVAKISSHYTMFYLIYMAVKLVYLIDSIYGVLIQISKGTGFAGGLTIMFIFSITISVIGPAALCQYCSNQAQSSVLLAHQLWNVDGSTDMMNEVKVFSLAMRKSPVKFSVGGVFTLNCHFVTKFSVTVLTYLIIAVQLSGNTSPEASTVATTLLNGTNIE